MISRILTDGTGTLAQAEAPEPEDPVLGRFIDALACDMARPQGILPVPAALAERAASLTDGVKVDLNQPLPPDDA